MNCIYIQDLAVMHLLGVDNGDALICKGDQKNFHFAVNETTA